MLEIEKIHHIAIICSNYELSKHFYTEILPFTIQARLVSQWGICIRIVFLSLAC